MTTQNRQKSNTKTNKKIWLGQPTAIHQGAYFVFYVSSKLLGLQLIGCFLLSVITLNSYTIVFKLNRLRVQDLLVPDSS